MIVVRRSTTSEKQVPQQDQQGQSDDNSLLSKINMRNLPTTLSLRDIVVVLASVVSIASAFFMYDTRISVIEAQIPVLQAFDTKGDTKHETLNTDMIKLDKTLTGIQAKLDGLISDVNRDEVVLERIKQQMQEIMIKLQTREKANP